MLNGKQFMSSNKTAKWCCMVILVLAILPLYASFSSAATNLAAGKVMSASSYNQTYAAGNTNDGNPSTYWESANNAFPQWLKVDLGSAASVNQVTLKLPASWGSRNQTVSLLGSSDDVTYTTLKASQTYTFDVNSANTVTIVFNAASVRYLKLNFTANTAWPAAQLAEFEVYGDAVTPNPTPTPTPSPGTTTTYQAENAVLSGSAAVTTNHTGYQGTGFVEGYWAQGAATTFNVNAASAGYMDVALRYGNGFAASSISLYVNGTKVTQSTLPTTNSWDTWLTKTETVYVTAGSNTIAYKYDAGDGANINLDQITVSASSAQKPDLTVTNIGWAPSGTLTEGANVTFQAEVTNSGTAATANVPHKVSFRINGNEIASGTASTSIAINGKTTITASSPWLSSSGSYAIVAVVDSDNTINEWNETNNSYTKSLTIAPLPGPDLIVQNVSWSPSNPQPGNAVSFTVTVKNQGADPANGAIAARAVIGSTTLNGSLSGGLAAGAVGTVSLSGSWTAVNGSTPVTATVDPANTIAEVKETNNTFSSSIGVSTAGPALPYAEVQAEDAVTNGTIIGPDRSYPSLAGEASGRKAVTLSAQGQYVEFTVPQNANSIVMRYSIPDNAAGTGITAPLALYINGVKQSDLTLTSKYGWIYGGYPFNNNPVDVRPHHFYDEVNRLVSQMTPGTKVKVQVDSGNNAGSYTIDLMDFEQVAPAATQPTGSLSLTADFGADPTGAVDATAATQNAVNTASAQGKVLWVPPGTYTINTQILVNNVTIRGAGIWYTKFHFTSSTGNSEGFYGNYAPNPSTNVHLSDFAIFGEVMTRIDNDQINGIGGALTNSTISNLWIEHTKCGMWLDGPFDNLKISGVRIRNQNADGINFHKGVTNSSVTQSFFRNTGDDALAMWSDSSGNAIPNANNAFTFNRVELPVLANGIALYGGTNNDVTDNYVADQQAEGGGIHVGNRFSPVTPVSGITHISRNTIIRSGSRDYYNGWNFGTGALWFFALDQPLNGTILVEDNKIIDSNYEAIHFIGSNISNITFNRDQIIGTGTYAIENRANGGSVTFNNVTATGLGRGSYFGNANGFTIVQGPGNSGWSATPVLIDPYPTPVYSPVVYP
ncbi:discoidin domain-containing protein [Paenibacillus sp. HWE-109]|uniref:CARDB domain-containing protein n=1 Tax=Paenibacillus sp. HWE-109 TaxID=1306526 RepID=UPI001EDDEA4C|nr:CARDB domain-containing protein [Paenibacillus sp. HWE-109]UKS29077.1 discoidin domain-containing protein [Paenibacillus sp. HWE-109]